MTDEKTISIAVTKSQAALLYDLLTRAAVAGPNAADMAALYSQAEKAVKAFG